MPRSNRTTSRTRRRSRRGRSHAARRSSGSSSTGWTRHGTALPGWGDLSTPNGRRKSRGDDGFLERVSTVRAALLILVLTGAFTLYVGHVHATQDLLARLQEARSENQTLHLKHNRLKGAYDRATGPTVIHQRARALGLRESLTYGPTIQVDE